MNEPAIAPTGPSGTSIDSTAAASIPLPQWIAVAKLSLAEIGAMVVIACHQTHADGNRGAWDERMNSKEMRNVLAGLQAKKVAGVSWQGRRVHRVICNPNVVKLE